MFCLKCGKELPDGAGFCSGCGEAAAAQKKGRNRAFLIGAAALAVAVLAVVLAVVNRGNQTPAPDTGGSDEISSSAPVGSGGYEEVLEEYFQAIKQRDAEKYLSFMILDFPGMPAISPHDRLDILEQLKANFRELDILEVGYSVRSAAPGSLSDFFHEEVSAWLAPQVEEVVRAEIDVRIRCTKESLSDVFVVWLMKTNEGRWYIIEDSNDRNILTR